MSADGAKLSLATQVRSLLHIRITLFIVALSVCAFVVASEARSVATTKARGLKLVAHRISLGNGKSFDLNLPEGFAIINGFLAAGKINGRPVDILSFGGDGFLLTDDYVGVVYYVHEK